MPVRFAGPCERGGSPAHDDVRKKRCPLRLEIARILAAFEMVWLRSAGQKDSWRVLKLQTYGLIFK